MLYGNEDSPIEVAPRTGAWIETYSTMPSWTRHQWSRPARARGLKRLALLGLISQAGRAPHGRVD